MLLVDHEYLCLTYHLLFTVVPTLTRPKHPQKSPQKCAKRLQSIPEVFKVKHKAPFIHSPQLAKLLYVTQLAPIPKLTDPTSVPKRLATNLFQWF